MIDLRPVGYVIGLLVAALGLTMVPPMLVDIAAREGHWQVFAESSLMTFMIGGLISLSCQNGNKDGLTLQQTFILTTGVWVALPLFGAIPFVMGATEARVVDAFFEAVQVNSDNATVRRNRLNLLSDIRKLVGSVADLSRIDG